MPGDITQQKTSPGGILKTKPPISLMLQVFAELSWAELSPLSLQWFTASGAHENLIRPVLDRNARIPHCLQDRFQIPADVNTTLHIHPVLFAPSMPAKSLPASHISHILMPATSINASLWDVAYCTYPWHELPHPILPTTLQGWAYFLSPFYTWKKNRERGEITSSSLIANK